MKKAILLAILILLWIPSSVFAINTSTGSSAPRAPMQRLTQIQEKRIEATNNKTENLKERAKKEINRRLEALNKLITKINSFKKISDEQKADLTNQVQTEIDSLNDLKNKIEAATEINTLREDVKSIVFSYRIYALFIPKIHLLAASDTIFETAGKMDELAKDIQTKITEEETNEKDVSALQKKLDEIQKQTENAKTLAQEVQDLVLPLTPEEFPGNKISLQNARKKIQQARLSLHTARNSAKTIINGLRNPKIGSLKTDSSSLSAR